MTQLTEYVRACFTGLWIETSEQAEAITEITRLCHAQQWNCQTWDIEQGLQPTSTSTSEGQADPLACSTDRHHWRWREAAARVAGELARQFKLWIAGTHNPVIDPSCYLFVDIRIPRS